MPPRCPPRCSLDADYGPAPASQQGLHAIACHPLVLTRGSECSARRRTCTPSESPPCSPPRVHPPVSTPPGPPPRVPPPRLVPRRPRVARDRRLRRAAPAAPLSLRADATSRRRPSHPGEGHVHDTSGACVPTGTSCSCSTRRGGPSTWDPPRPPPTTFAASASAQPSRARARTWPTCCSTRSRAPSARRSRQRRRRTSRRPTARASPSPLRPSAEAAAPGPITAARGGD